MKSQSNSTSSCDSELTAQKSGLLQKVVFFKKKKKERKKRKKGKREGMSNWGSLAGRRRPPNFGGEEEEPGAVMPSTVPVGSSPPKPIGRSFVGGLDVTL